MNWWKSPYPKPVSGLLLLLALTAGLHLAWRHESSTERLQGGMAALAELRQKAAGEPVTLP